MSKKIGATVTLIPHPRPCEYVLVCASTSRRQASAFLVGGKPCCVFCLRELRKEGKK